MKPRANAKLKTLPDQQQEKIAQFARNHTLAQTVVWLRETGISAVSQFLRWFNHREQLARNEQALRNAIVDLVRNGAAPTAETLSQIGNTIFAGSALEKQDPRAWFMSQQIYLRKAALDLKSKQLKQN